MIRKLHVAAGFCLILSLPHAWGAAPYLGGAGNGFAGAQLPNQTLGGVVQPAEAYLGGGSGGDGFDGDRVSDHPLNSPPPLGPEDARFFAGSGGGDGFSAIMRSNQILGSAPDPAWDVLARAGTSGGDGFAAGRITAVPLTPAPPDPGLSAPFTAGSAGGDGFGAGNRANHVLGPAPLYSVLEMTGGGAGDGFVGSGLTNHAMGPPVDYAVLQMVSGGTGDGFAAAAIPDFPLTPPSGPSEMIAYFAGTGGGDGFDGFLLANHALGGASIPVLAFSGGSGDGFSSASLPNHPLDLWMDPVGPYLGGVADGFDADMLVNWQMEILLGSPATYATWQAIRFAPEQIAAGLADPNADADSDGLENLLEFVLGSDLLDGSEVPVIGSTLASPSDFGGVADGNDYLTLDFPISPYALGVIKEVQFSDALNAISWSSAGSVILLNQPGRLVVRDGVSVGTVPARFGRLSVQLEP